MMPSPNWLRAALFAAAILPIALTGQYEGKFALAPTVKATKEQAAILAKLPRATIADSDRKWVGSH